MRASGNEESGRAQGEATLESLLGYAFKNPGLLQTALTHRSFVNESDEAGLQNNESLEFLGDAVLGFLVSARIYNSYPSLTEGELSRIKAYLVSSANIVGVAEGLRLGDHLRLGRGEEKTGGRRKRAILVDACEAILGAVYLDGGIDAAAAVFETHMGPVIEELDRARLIGGDFKSALQEYLHEVALPEPQYEVVDEVGPDHKKVFVVEVRIGDRVTCRSSGTSKKEAQQEAARLALKTLKQNQDDSRAGNEVDE